MEVILKEMDMLSQNIRKKTNLKIWMLFQILWNQTFHLSKRIKRLLRKCKLMNMTRMSRMPHNFRKIQKTEGNKWLNKMLKILNRNLQRPHKLKFIKGFKFLQIAINNTFHQTKVTVMMKNLPVMAWMMGLLSIRRLRGIKKMIKLLIPIFWVAKKVKPISKIQMLKIRSKTKIPKVSRTNNLVKWMHLTKKTTRNLVIMINRGLLDSTMKKVEANLIIQLTTNKLLNNLKFNLKKKDRILQMRLRRIKRVKMVLSRNKKLQLLLSRNKNHPLKKIKRMQMLLNRNKYQTP
jgi:hypothetical protein